MAQAKKKRAKKPAVSHKIEHSVAFKMKSNYGYGSSQVEFTAKRNGNKVTIEGGCDPYEINLADLKKVVDLLGKRITVKAE